MNLPGLKVPESIQNFGLVGERKALALLALAFFASVFGLMGLIATLQIPEWSACFYALGAIYALGFFALAADWFWGRWFASGLGMSGVTMAIMGIVTTRDPNVALIVFGGLHAIIAAALLGTRMGERYELRADWRQKWNLDDEGVLKVRRTVQRAASSLPGLVMFALAPRQDAESLALLSLVGVAGLGLFGLLRGRTWGLLALGLAGAGAIVSALGVPASMAATDLGNFALPTTLLGLVSGALLLSAVAPFAPRMLRHLVARP